MIFLFFLTRKSFFFCRKWCICHYVGSTPLVNVTWKKRGYSAKEYFYNQNYLICIYGILLCCHTIYRHTKTRDIGISKISAIQFLTNFFSNFGDNFSHTKKTQVILPINFLVWRENNWYSVNLKLYIL